MKQLLLILTIFTFSGSFAQIAYNDLNEYNFKGSVKRITTYDYDTLAFGRNNIIRDKVNWKTKLVYNFNELANFESKYLFVQLPGTDTVYESGTAYYYSYESRYAVRINGNKEVTDTLTFHWINDTTYQTVENSVKGKQKVISELYLNSKYRDKGGKFTGYDKRGDLEFNEKYENILDADGYLVKSLTTDLLTDKTTIIEYQYSDFDRAGNPTKIVFFHLPEKKVIRIVLREFEYY